MPARRPRCDLCISGSYSTRGTSAAHFLARGPGERVTCFLDSQATSRPMAHTQMVFRALPRIPGQAEPALGKPAGHAGAAVRGPCWVGGKTFGRSLPRSPTSSDAGGRKGKSDSVDAVAIARQRLPPSLASPLRAPWPSGPHGPSADRRRNGHCALAPNGCLMGEIMPRFAQSCGSRETCGSCSWGRLLACNAQSVVRK